MRSLIPLLTLLISFASFSQEEPGVPVAERLKDSCEVAVVGSSGMIANYVFSPEFCLEYRLGVTSTCPLEDFDFTVYNRWGEVVYHSEKQEEYWDGTYKSTGMVPDGVYVYLLKYTNPNGEKINRKGHITVIK